MRAADIEGGRLPRPPLGRYERAEFYQRLSGGSGDAAELAATAACRRAEARSRPGREGAVLNYIIISIIYEFRSFIPKGAILPPIRIKAANPSLDREISMAELIRDR